MIAKRVPREKSHSNFRHLAEYVLDKKHDGQKLAASWTTNTSLPDDFDLAIIEAQSTQELNTRSKNDKTYHLVISLAEGERIGIEQFKEVERRCCEAIGLGEHHRICAIHHDTNIIHLHIALSKVHPVTLNTIEPYYDKFKLQQVCRECEKVFALQPGIGPGKQEKRNIVEIRQGVDSFQAWIKAHLRDDLLAVMIGSARSWSDVQCLAGRYGLEIREHKTGLVFSHVSEKLFVKGSSVDRSFSKKSMEDRFGKFEPATQAVTPIMKYQRGINSGNDKENMLYASFQAEMSKIRCDRREQVKCLLEQRSSAITDIRARYAIRRQQVALDPILTKANKFQIRKCLSTQMKCEIQRQFKDMQAGKKAIMESNVTKSWQKWLYDQSKAGHENALEILKQRQEVREDRWVALPIVCR